MLTEKQRIERQSYLGASDSAIIMGFSTFKTPYELYLEKTGIVSIEEEEQSEQQYWGNTLERVILDEFCRRNKSTMEFPDTITHRKHSFIKANLDGFCPELNAIVEAKNANSFMRQYWDDSYQDGMPMQYLIQVAKQVACADVDIGYCAVLLGGNEYKQFIYHRDLELEDKIICADVAFWDCVQMRVEPELTQLSDFKLKYPESQGARITLPSSMMPIIEELLDIRKSIKRWDDRAEKLKMEIMKLMQDKDTLVDEKNTVLATWKKGKKSRSFLLK